MSHKQASTKSKKHTVTKTETRFYRDTLVEWEDDGIYILAYHKYIRIFEMADLEYKMKSRQYGSPLYLREEDITGQFNSHNQLKGD